MASTRSPSAAASTVDQGYLSQRLWTQSTHRCVLTLSFSTITRLLLLHAGYVMPLQPMMTSEAHAAPKAGTGFFLPRTSGGPKDKATSRRDNKARGTNQQAAHRASLSTTTALQQHQMPQLVILQHQQQLASPFCSSSTLLNSSFTSNASSSPFAGDYAGDSFSLTPCNSGSCCASQGSFVCDAANLGPAVPMVCQQPPQQVLAVTPMMVAGAGVIGQDLLLLQQQEAEVDAAISDLLSLRQQLSARRQQPAPVAPVCGSFSVSHATAALGQQPAVGSATLSSAQLQLASLQAQQQQLQTFEERLQEELAAQMVRLLGLA